MEMNCSVGRNNMGDSSAYYCLPEPNNCYQQRLFMPMIPLSLMVNAASAASASAFHVNEYTNSYNLDSANSMAVNFAGRNFTGELDRYILMQTEQLISTLQQQLSSFAMNLEAQFLLLLTQKDKDLGEEKKRVMKLIAVLKKVLIEKEKWQRIARKLIIVVSALKGTLEKVQKPCFSSTGETKREEEVASCFSSPTEEDDDGNEPSAKRQKGNTHDSSSLCQNCSSSSACVLILPCRHLCLCKQCEVLQCRCPVCKCVKKETVEVLF